MNLSTKFMGLNLKNPIIAGSSGMTSNLRNIIELEKNGVAAVVLKSLFEEQIVFNASGVPAEGERGGQFPDAQEYVERHSGKKAVDDYIRLIADCKANLSIPVIASINCVTPNEWTVFAHQAEQAGADAIELNIFFLRPDPQQMTLSVEETYLEIIKEVLRNVTIPVCVKANPYFSALAHSLFRFSFTGIKGLVLFNKFFPPDIDIEEFKVVAGAPFSNPEDLGHSLRWIAMLSDRIYCDVAGSNGIHDGKGLVKVLLAGAKAAEIASVLYTKGPAEIGVMLKFLEDYLGRHGFSSVTEIIGKMSMRQIENPADFERVQYIKYYSGIE